MMSPSREPAQPCNHRLGNPQPNNAQPSQLESDSDSDTPLLYRRFKMMSKKADNANIRNGKGTAAQRQKASPGSIDGMVCGTQAKDGNALGVLSQKPLARSIMETALKKVEHYAGPNARQLEEEYFKWVASGKPHDSICLLCLRKDTEISCSTCCRVYHEYCIELSLTEKKDGEFFCPLCVKRTWSDRPPSTTASKGQRLLLLASKLLSENAFTTWIQWNDSGDPESDQRVLFDMGAAAEGKVSETNTNGYCLATDENPSSYMHREMPVKEECVEEYLGSAEAHVRVGRAAIHLCCDDDEVECIRCICLKHSQADEHRSNMICCDQCFVWQHLKCMGLPNHHNPEKYFCEQCRPQDHRELLEAKARGLKPWEQEISSVLQEKSAEDNVNVTTYQPTASSTTSSVPRSHLSHNDSTGFNSVSTVSRIQGNEINDRQKSIRRPISSINGGKRSGRSHESCSDGIIQGTQATDVSRKADEILIPNQRESSAFNDYTQVSSQRTQPPYPVSALAYQILGHLVIAPGVIPVLQKYPGLDARHLRIYKEMLEHFPDLAANPRKPERVFATLRAQFLSEHSQLEPLNGGLPGVPVAPRIGISPLPQHNTLLNRGGLPRTEPYISSPYFSSTGSAGDSQHRSPSSAMSQVHHFNRSSANHGQVHRNSTNTRVPTSQGTPSLRIHHNGERVDNTTGNPNLDHAIAILGPEIASQPAIKQLATLDMAKNKSFWNIVKITIDDDPYAVSNLGQLKDRIQAAMPFYYIGLKASPTEQNCQTFGSTTMN